MICETCPYYDWSISGIWCDKVGGKTGWYGWCSEVEPELNESPKYEYVKKIRKNKYFRDKKYKQKLKYLYSITKTGYPSPVRYVDEMYIGRNCWNKNDKPYYKRLYNSGRKHNRFKYYKKYSNKCVRRYIGEIHKGNSYRKIFDYWWSII